MKKLIHLSDIHLGHADCGEKFRVITEKIISTMQPASDYIVLITGDIVDNANRDDFFSEALEYIENLRNNGFLVLVVPGNHDYGNGALGDKKFVKPFKEKFYNNSHITYPKLDIIGNYAFIGLDSTAEELHWLDRILSEGELGRKQRQRLKKMLKLPEVAACKKIVYLHHHPFDFRLAMQLKDREKLRKIIEGKIDLLLFGHYHRDHDGSGSYIHGTWRIPRCYNAGTSTHKNGEPGYQRVIDLEAVDASNDFDARLI